MELNATSRGYRAAAASAWLLAIGTAVGACSSSAPPGSSSPPDARAIADAPPAPALWGDLKPIVSVRELMKYMIDPVADNIFNAVGSTLTKKGMVDVVPKTDEDWEKIRIGAVSLAEAADLLKIPRPFTPPGDENNSQGPDAVELSPAAITAKVQRDPVEWNARIQAMRNVALEVLDVVKRRDVDELWDAGENLDKACEACHRSYWYPGESAEFYQKLRQRLQEFSEQSRGGAAAPPHK
jgi:cytochrome c556